MMTAPVLQGGFALRIAQIDRIPRVTYGTP